ncbi:MAG: hypothetical protein E6G44_11490 [Actinobacteria bacterium]|nr:MAG: hypothetical protein E6G44_11490 [Actinomycetota bacterium]
MTARVPSGATTGPITVTTPDGSATSTDSFDAIPIEHVVVIYQENHSFDNVLGAWCEKNHRCDGVTSGKTSTGREVKLGTSPDVAPTVAHSHAAQLTAIDGGKMDGFDRIRGCKPPKYPCYVQYQPPQIPNLIAYADAYALSDATFEDDTHMSFGSHLDLLAATADGFTGNNPQRTNFGKGPGWGCDSFRDAQYYFQSKTILVPACVPDQAGNGPYRSSPVSYVPTILTRLESAGISFGLYLGPGNTAGGDGYNWAPCPYFYECLGGSQADRWHPASQILTDASNGTLPAVSFVTPTGPNSQHNGNSMAQGDNWIGSIVSAIQRNEDLWRSTAIFITYDDCGCFYDHVPPPSGRGIRVPMVIVSPYARAEFTDHNPARFDSMLAYIEHTFGLQSLGQGDADAYDYADAFDYGQIPLGGVRAVRTPIPRWEMRWIAAHPQSQEDGIT